MDAMQQVLTRGARGELKIETDRVALAEFERMWERQVESGRRVVVVV
jgi:hypothetical protein